MIATLLLSALVLAPHAWTAQSVGSNATAGTTPKGETVMPGDDHNNGDVHAYNTSTAKKKIYVYPKKTNSDGNSTVTCKNKAKGRVDGVDHGDTVNVSSGCEMTINGSGGTVNVSGTSTSTIITNASGSTSNMTVNMPSNVTISVPPGSTITVTT